MPIARMADAPMPWTAYGAIPVTRMVPASPMTNALHQLPSVLRPDLQPTLDPSMLAALVAMTIAFTCLYGYLMIARVDVELRRQARIIEARA